MLCYKCVIAIFIVSSLSNKNCIVSATTTENAAANTNKLDESSSNTNPPPNTLRQFPPFGGGQQPPFNGGQQPPFIGGPQPPFGSGPAIGNGCPLCDSSVYSYCSHKALHDMCCCDFQGGYFRPQQCLYADCTLLFAKTCFESLLIRNCCCNKP